jgi:myosin-5
MKVTSSQKDVRARASASLITKLESQIDSAEATIREKERENANLREKLERYETLWAEFSGLEAMWRMQITSIQRQINAAKQSIRSQGDSPPELPKLDDASSFKSSLTSTPRGSRHILPYNNDILPQNTMIRRNNSILQHNNDMIQHKDSEIMDEFDWDETASSADSASSENYSTLQKTASQTLYLSPEKRAAVSDRSLVSELRQEFEHRQQVFMDDAEFVKEVKSGQTEAYLNPDEELGKLKERFVAWTKEFKDKLKNTKGVLQKLGDGEAAPKVKKWWSKPKVLLHGL